MSQSVYMDHSATTAVRREVLDAMMPYFSTVFGNASSIHRFGQEAKSALEGSREKVAALLGTEAENIIFTSGGTESDNLAIKGVLSARKRVPPGHIITSATEHHAVLRPFSRLEKQGWDVTYLPVNADGLVSASDLKSALRDDTALVSIMLANNETGVVQPVRELAEAVAETGAVFHTDAVQAVGKIPVNVDELGVDLLSLSAHKFYGPKGVGVLYRRSGVRIEAQQHGGHHENRLRGGTENVAGIVGLAQALELACGEMDAEEKRLSDMRDSLEQGITARIEDIKVNAAGAPRLPHLLNVSIEGIEGESMLLLMDSRGIALSTGSACTSGTLEPSHVLTAMGIPPEKAHGSLRFSLGLINHESQVDYVLDSLCEVVEQLRKMSPTYTAS